MKSVFKNEDGAILFLELIVLAVVLAVAALAGYNYLQHKNASSVAPKPKPHVASTASPSPSITPTAQSTATTPATVAAKIVITAVKIQDGAVFDNPPDPYGPKGNQLVVYATMTNLSSGTQTYQVTDFTAITNTGEVVKSRNTAYAAGQSKGLWYSTALSAGGSGNIVMIFDPSQTISTLNWSPGGSTSAITVAVPSPSQ